MGGRNACAAAGVPQANWYRKNRKSPVPARPLTPRRPHQGIWYHLYTIIDIYSRCVVGWMVASRESATPAKRLIAAAAVKQKVDRDTLTLHADRGSSMKSKAVAELLIDLGVAKSHGRPKTSNDNPHIEASFKTLKYCPTFPGRFGSIEDARAFCQDFYRPCCSILSQAVRVRSRVAR